jgi:hypothetical protein
MTAHDISGAAATGLGAALAWRDDAPNTGLVALPWFAFEVVSSTSSRRAAARIARRTERAYWVLRRALDVAPRVRLLVLDQDDWPRHAERPEFGVTHLTAAGDLVVGAEPAEAWSVLSAWLRDSLDPRTLSRLLHLHGRDLRTGGPALGAIAEALVAHELGHRFAAASGVRFPRRWLDEAFANYAMVAVLGETDPLGLRRLGSLAEAVESLDAELPPLTHFETRFGELDLASSVLAQLALTRGVYQAYAAAESAPLARMFRLFTTTVASDRLPDHEIVRLLALHAHPTLAAIPALFPPAPFRAAA